MFVPLKTSSNTLLVIAINVAAIIVLMDLSAINIALPIIREQLDLSIPSVSLILMASMLSATGSALVMGKLIELYPPSRILVLAFSLFGITTTASAFAPNFTILIILRFIQGFAEAALYVIGPALIKKFIAAQAQQKQHGLWMMSTGLGISLGPIIGGLLLSLYSWQAIFLINLPLSIIGLIISLYLAKSLKTKSLKASDFDIKGSIYSFSFLALIIIFFNLIGNKNTTFLILFVVLGLSLTALFLFIRQEKNTKNPLFKLQLFTISNFRQANIGFFLFFFINVGSRFMRPFFFEETRGFSTSLSGLLMMISPAIMLLISFYIDLLEKHFSTKQLVISGNILLSISMLMFSFWNEQSSLIFLICSLLILGIAMGIFYPTAAQLGMKSLPQGSYGTGSASISISKSIGKLMGVLIFGLLFQIFFQLLLQHSPLDTQKAIPFVFFVAFIVSLINTRFSFHIKP
ncbi:MAG: hypothetical protein B7C24_05825 [Bacteroidetes bacterium 4572_77]|nr:MAG: hypothetical protein B7C24_05825 [Bacteroidetes bacterium 4572_77]